jgi:hypothetical protein
LHHQQILNELIRRRPYPRRHANKKDAAGLSRPRPAWQERSEGRQANVLKLDTGDSFLRGPRTEAGIDRWCELAPFSLASNERNEALPGCCSPDSQAFFGLRLSAQNY